MPEHATVGLERALAALAPRIEYPSTPPLAPAVTARLATERRNGARPPFPSFALWTRRRLLVAVALGLLALLGIAAAARLAIGALEIRVVPTLAPSPTETPLPDAIGRAVTLDQARAAVAFELRLPGGLREPDTVRVFRSPFGDRSVLLAWTDPSLPSVEGTPWTLVLWELPGDEGYAFKLVATEGQIREVEVAGRRGYWLDAPHQLVLGTPTQDQTYQVNGHVLVWDAGDGLALRMETALSLGHALALAETIR